MKADDENHILLIGDDPGGAEAALHALRCGHLANRVHRARDGVEALRFLFSGRDTSQSLRLILLDLEVPGLDGSELLRVVRADPRTRLTPVVVMTSSPTAQDVVPGIGLGLCGFVPKPVRDEDFSRVMSRLGLQSLLAGRPAGSDDEGRT